MQPTGASRRSAQAVAVVLMLGVAAVALVVLASAGGSVRPVSESTIVSSPRPIPTLSVTPKVAPPAFNSPPPVREGTPHQMPTWLKAILTTLLYVAGSLLVLFLLRLLYRMIRNVELPVAETNDADDWERVKVDKLSDAVEAGLAAMESGTATDAVIACWVALEDADEENGGMVVVLPALPRSMKFRRSTRPRLPGSAFSRRSERRDRGRQFERDGAPNRVSLRALHENFDGEVVGLAHRFDPPHVLRFPSEFQKLSRTGDAAS